MSAEENVEVFRRSVEVWNRDDWAGLEAIVDPEIEIQAPEGWPETGEFRGWPAVRAQYERLKDSWSDERIVVIDATPVNDDRVLAHVNWVGHGEASGLELDLEGWNPYTIRGGRIARIEFYFDADDARRAAGSPC